MMSSGDPNTVDPVARLSNVNLLFGHASAYAAVVDWRTPAQLMRGEEPSSEEDLDDEVPF